jgi:PAS domain S-box-containing protein
MNNSDKTKELLIEEITQLRRQIERLQHIDAEHKKAEQALRESEARYKAIFNSATEGITVAEIETRRFRYANPTICKMFGYTEEELRRMTVPDISPKEFMQQANLEFDAHTRGEREISHNVPCLRKNGTLFYADINSTNVVIDQRPCNVGFFTDTTQHKRAEESLRDSQARYKAIFESAREGILVADIETKRFKYANPAICKMLGYTENELGQMSVSDIHLKEHLAQVISYFEAQVRGEIVLAHNVPCLRKDGTIFYADINSTKVVIDQRPCNVGFFTDVTQPRRAEEALRESEQRYRLLVEQLPAITYTAALDAASTTIYVSPQIEEILGVSQADYKADPDLWRKLLHPDDSQRVMADLAASHQTREPFSSEYRMLAKDGRVVWIHDDARIIEDSEGGPLYLQGVMYDVTEHKNTEEMLQKAHDELETRVRQRTADLAQVVEELQKEIAERKHAEESLRKAEERFRTIFENTVVGLYRTTPDGQILMANPALVKMMGYQSFEELAQLNLEKEGLDSSTPRWVFKQRIEKEGKVIGLESVWIRRDGTKLFVSESAFALRDDSGNILYYEGTAQDITKRKKAEEKLLLYQEQLRSLASQLSLAEERLRRRIATELHDHISQNLAISKIKLESLTDPAKPDLAKSLNEVIDLLAQTIDVTRSLTFEVSPPVLYELGFEAAVGWLARQTKQRFGLEVEFTDDGKSKPLDTDIRVLLFQAVRELLVNVVKHAKAGKAKVTTARLTGSGPGLRRDVSSGGRDHIRITVEDDGVGFDVSSTSTNAGDYSKGGFGLFNIRERLDHIGGSVDIRSRPGHGTRVTLIAPINGKTQKPAPIL